MKHLHQTDPDIFQFIKQELLRQQDGLEITPLPPLWKLKDPS